MEGEILKWKQIWWTRWALRHSMPRPCPHWTIQCNFRATLIKVKSPYVVHLNLPFIVWGVQDQIETILIKEFFTKDTYGITWHDITSIISSSSSSVGYNPIDLITAPSSFVETVPSPSCAKGLNKQTIFKQSCKTTLILLVTKRLFRRNLIIQNLHIDM